MTQLPLIADAAPLVAAIEPFAQFELTGEVVPKGRPRAMIMRRASKHPIVRLYTPKETRDYEDAVKLTAKVSMRGRAPTLLPVSVLVHVYLPIPPSWKDRQKNDARSGALLPTSKPDADNYLKVLDALNGVVFKDDAQIVNAQIIKRYSDSPSLRVGVWEMVPPK